MLNLIYAEMQRRGLVTSMRDFSTEWCVRAPNYACENKVKEDVPLVVLRTLAYGLFAAGHFDLTLDVVRLMLSPTYKPEWTTER